MLSLRVSRYNIHSGVSLGVIQTSFILFFIYLGDAILSFWAPNLIETTLGGATKMGLVIGFSSLVGLAADLTMPQLLRSMRIKKLIAIGAVSGILFAAFLLLANFKPYLSIFLLAMAIWGIYYEFLGFATHQYIAEDVPPQKHTSAWAIFGLFKNTSYFLGPLIAAWVIIKNPISIPFVAALFSLVGIVILTLISTDSHKKKISSESATIHPLLEIKHWNTLLRHIWPVIVTSLLLGLVDSAFWTIGAVWTEKLANVSTFGSLFLPFYILPSLVTGFVVAKWGATSGKKKISELFLLSAGASLAALSYSSNIFWQLAGVLVASTALAISSPLSEAVYSDIIARMGREKKELIGLSRSSNSIAYIIGPIFAGLVADRIGERQTFAALGLSVIIVSLFLLAVTPRKLKLPQNQIRTWS